MSTPPTPATSTPGHTTATAARGGAVLSVRDLTVGFRARAGATSTVVDSLSLDLPAGGSLAIVGESGSGKTVSMRALLRLLPENAQITGQAHYNGADLLALPREALRAVRGRQIGMVFQNAMDALNPTRTLKRQLTEPLLWHGICTRSEAVDRAVAALDRVGIPEPARRITMYPFQLSGGMRQRAMIAMAVITNPTILIADEPTTAVDVTLQRQVLDLLKDLQRDGLSLIMITHDLGVARYTCEDLIVMRHGKVVETAPMATFSTTATHPYSRELLDAALDVEPPTSDHEPSGKLEITPTTADASPTATTNTTTASQPPTTPTAATAATLADQPPATDAPDTDQQAGGDVLLEAHGLVKVFHGRGGDVRAVDHVSLHIAPGETVAVVGESGSGKSTLARLSMRLIDPTEGDLRFDGHDMLTLKGANLRHMRRQVQMVFQNPYGSLLPHLSIAANVAEPLRVHRIGTPTERRQQAIGLLELVGIPAERADFYPRQFSGGQQQRVAIARALALEPRLLVCDEPTSALDVSIQAQILDLLRDLQQRLTIAMIFVTHNLAVAQNLADRIIVMAQGHVVETAPTTQLFTHPHHPYTQALLAAVLPVRGDPLDWRPGTTVDVTSGELREITPRHWVRTNHQTQQPTHQTAQENH